MAMVQFLSEVLGDGANSIELELLESRPRTGSSLDVGRRSLESLEMRLRRCVLHVRGFHHDTGLTSTVRQCRSAAAPVPVLATTPSSSCTHT
jgi:hypothetical protein